MNVSSRFAAPLFAVGIWAAPFQFSSASTVGVNEPTEWSRDDAETAYVSFDIFTGITGGIGGDSGSGSNGVASATLAIVSEDTDAFGPMLLGGPAPADNRIYTGDEQMSFSLTLEPKFQTDYALVQIVEQGGPNGFDSVSLGGFEPSSTSSEMFTEEGKTVWRYAWDIDALEGGMESGSLELLMNEEAVGHLSFDSVTVDLSSSSNVIPEPTLPSNFGAFVIHPERGNGAHRFTYWESFTQPFDAPNFARESSQDAAGNRSNYIDNVTITQTEPVEAFVTGSGSIYSFSGSTKFDIEYFDDGGEPITGIVCQFQTGGATIDLDLVTLIYQSVDTDGQPIEVTRKGQFHTYHEPGEGGFADRVASGAEWVISPEDPPVKDFVIKLDSPAASMPVYQAQLDVVTVPNYAGILGRLLNIEQEPVHRHGQPLTITVNSPDTDETRFFRPGQSIELEAMPSDPEAFAFVGWKSPLNLEANPLTHTFGDEDFAATALYAPLSYQAWRDVTFHHIATVGEDPDDLDELVSGLSADLDGDGLVNQLEYAFGGDPYVMDSGVITPRIERLDDGTIEITHRRWKLPSEMQNIRYVPESSADLEIWNLVEDVIETNTHDNDDGTESVTMRVSGGATESAEFYRLSILLN